jgi:hypothetical protein
VDLTEGGLRILNTRRSLGHSLIRGTVLKWHSEVSTVPSLELTDQQVVDFVKQLPPGRQRSILHELTPGVARSEEGPLGSNDATTEQRFRELARQWKEATQFVSSVTGMVTHPAYQQIIGMGREVLPLILAELRRKPDHWFWALQAITRENPVRPADRGRLQAMTQAWLDWAAAHGY